MQVSRFMFLLIQLWRYDIFRRIANTAKSISDIRMPALIGFQIVRRVKDLRPDMKVIMMTLFEVNKREFEAIFPSTPIDV
jgi:DNA-binding NtrC family response regulator